jgi:hypothetical protein
MSHVQEQKEKSIPLQPSLLSATEQLLDAIALHYAHVLIEHVSFVVLVTEENRRVENYSTQITRKIAGEQKGVLGGGKSVSNTS